MPSTQTSEPSIVAGGTGTALFGIVLIAINMRTSTAGVGPTLPSIIKDLDWTSAFSSGLVVIPLLCYAILSPFAPAISRLLGINRTVLMCLAVVAAGIALRSLPGQVWIWVGTGLLGAGIGVLNVVAPALIKRDFANRVGPATATYTAVQGGAAALATAAVAVIIGISSDLWRLALASSVVFAIGGCIFWAYRAFGAERHPRPNPPVALRHNKVRGPWHRGLAWHLAVFMSMQATVFYVLITWLPTIEQEHGIPALHASLHQSYLQGASLIATVFGASLLLRGPGQRAIVVVATAVMAIGIVGVLTVPTFAGLWAALVGAGGGLTLVTALSLFSLRTTNAAETAAVSAMAQAVGYLVAASGPVLLGVLHDAMGSWRPVLMILLGLLAIQTISGLRAAKPGYVWD
jgi:CP family cyanate transporter-like MFS transporter